MRLRQTIPGLSDLATRTVEYRDTARGADALRQISDAARADTWGRAVEVCVSTDSDGQHLCACGCGWLRGLCDGDSR